MVKGNNSVAGYLQWPDFRKNPCLLAVCRRMSTCFETFMFIQSLRRQSLDVLTLSPA